MKTATSKIQQRKINNSRGVPTIRGHRSHIVLKQPEQIDKALLESEKKYQNLFEHARDAIVLADIHTGTILDVNTACCNLLGLPKEEIVGKNFTIIHPPELVEQYRQLFKEHVQKGIVIGDDIIIQRADGTRIPMDISASVVKYGDKTIIQGIFRDVTERARVAEALRESNENISKAFKAIPEAVAIATLKDGVILEVNDSFALLNGYSREELIGHTAKELNIWANSDDRYRMKQLMDKHNHFENEEFVFRRKSGETHTILLSADVINYDGKRCILTIGTDITQRKQAEEALRESEERFHNIVEHGNDGIVFIQEGIIQYCNTKLLEISGYKEKEVLGKPFIDFIAPEHKQMVFDIYKKRITGEKTPERYELTMVGKGGRKVYTEVSASLNYLNQKQVDIAIIRDITERKKAEQTLTDEATRRRILVEQSIDGIVILDQDGGVFEANQRFADMLGYTMDEMKNLHVFDWEFLYPKEQVVEMINTVDEKGDHFETQHKRKDGTTYDVEISTNGATFAGQKLIFCVCRDITERKRMEQVLRESAREVSKAFDAIPEAISIATLEDEVFIKVNDSFISLHGYSREEVIGHTAQDLNLMVKPEDFDRIEQLLSKQTRFQNEEFLIRRKSGEIRTVLLSGDIIIFDGKSCILVACNDITKRKKIETLQKSENAILTLLGQGTELNKILDAIMRLCEQNDPTIKASIMLYDSSKNWLNGSGPSFSDEYNKLLKTGIPVMANTGSCGTAAYRKKRVVVKDIGNSPLFKSSPEVIKLAAKNGLYACWSEPIISSQGELLGTIANYNDHVGKPTADNINVLEWSARTAAIAIERKRMEQALRESEKEMTKVFHTIPEGVTIASLEDEKFIEVNDSFISLSGYTREEIIGHSAKELNLTPDPDGQAKLNYLLNERKSCKNEELLFRDKSGGWHNVLISADLINFKGKMCAMVINNDISELKKAEQALRESEEKFSKSFHAIPEAVSIVRMKDGIFIDVNESFCRQNGCDRDNVIGHTGKDLNIWIDPSEREQIMELVNKQGRVENMECHFIKKTGEPHTVLMSADKINLGDETCMLSIATDITERKRMEQALAESEEKFSKAFHAIPETLSISSLKDGRFIDINESFLKLNQLTREETIGRTGDELQFIKPGDDRGQIKELVKKTGRFNNVEIEFKAKSGEMLTFLFSADVIEISGERCLLIIGNDITKRKHAQRNLQQALRDLERSTIQLRETNKELESFSYSVSHDLRSPLRSIDGFSEALLEDYSNKLDEKGQDYLTRIRRASQKMGELIDALLKLSRVTRNEIHEEKIDLGALAKEITDRLQETDSKRRVKFIIGDDLNVNGDPQMFRVLLENLLSNAWKFTAKTPHAVIEVGKTANGAKKAFYVKDNGAGFDMAFKDKLFGAFQRLHNATEFPGTGIGLATVQRIIHRHGGNIWAESEIDKGATFYFSLS